MNEQYLIEKLETIENLLQELKHVSKSVLSSEEVARYCNLSSSYLYKLTSKKKIPFYKPFGKMIYFKRPELDGWLLQNRVKPDDELEQDACVLFVFLVVAVVIMVVCI